MKYLLITLLFSLSLIAQDKIRFENGEFWDGQLKELKDDRLVLNSNIAEKDLEFYTKGLKSITFGNSKPLKGTTRVTLTNGDGLIGELEELNSEFLVIKTENAGLIQLPRKVVYSMEFEQAAGKTIVSGITQAGGWTGSLEEDNIIKNNVNKEIKIDGPIILTTLIDLSEARNFHVMLNNYSAKNPHGRFYANFQVNSGQRIIIQNGQRQVANTSQMNLYSNVSNGTERANLGHKAFESADKELFLQIYLNPEESFVAVKVDNVEIGKAKLNSKFEFDSLNISLRSHAGKVHVRKFSIENWSGGYSSLISSESSAEHDNVFLINGDIAHGKVVNVKEEKLTFESKLGKQVIPTNFVSSLTLKNTKIEEKSGFFVHQKSGQTLTGELQKIDNEFIYLKSSLLDNIKIKKEFCYSVSNSVKQAKSSGSSPDTVAFGKSKIFGDILNLKDNRLKIDNVNMVEKLELNLQDLASVQFGNQFKQEQKSGWTVELLNGDSIPGDVTGYKDGMISIDSEAGKFNIPTANVSRLIKSRNIQRRVVTNGNVRVFSAGFNNNIKVDTNEKTEVNFTINSKPVNGKHWNNYFQLRLFGDKVSRNSYYFQFSSNPRIHFKRNIEVEKHIDIVNKESMNVSLKIDKSKGVFQLWVEGKHTYTFTDPKGFQGAGDYFTVYANNNVQVSRLHIQDWSEKVSDVEEYIIDDKWKLHAGKVSKIEDGKLHLNDKVFDMDDLKEINLKQSNNEVKKSPYTIQLINGAQLSAESFSIIENQLIFKNDVFKEYKISKEAVLRIQKD